MEQRNVMVLITDFCNQNCKFCFAREEMKSPLKKEISIEDFRLLTNKLKRNNILGVSLVGGEPTIHSQFSKILSYALNQFIFVNVLTNGIFSKEAKKALLKACPRIPIQFNITTPGFINNPQIRRLVLDHIEEFTNKTSTIITITSNFMDISLIKQVFEYFSPQLLRKVAVRLGVEKPLAGAENSVKVANFLHMGANIVEVVRFLDERGPPRGIATNRGMIFPCMFSAEEKHYLSKMGIWNKGYLKGFQTHRLYEPYWFAINPSLETFKFYSLSTRDKFKINRQTDLAIIKKKYNSLHEGYDKKLVLPECKKCSFYGFKKTQCSGPCIAFRINALRNPV